MYLLDTNILSELVKKPPCPALMEKLQAVHPETLHTASPSFVSLSYPHHPGDK